MADTSKPPLAVEGIHCPDCRNVRLFVVKTRRPSSDRIVRTRECSACGLRIVTQEKVVSVRRRSSSGKIVSVRPSASTVVGG